MYKLIYVPLVGIIVGLRLQYEILVPRGVTKIIAQKLSDLRTCSNNIMES